GEATLLAALGAVTTRRPLLLAGTLLIALGGLAVWTHPLGAVYVLPAGLYVALRGRRNLPRWSVALGLLAALAVAAVLLRAFFAARLPDTPGALQGLQLAQGPANLARLLRVGGAVLVGLAQGTTNEPLFDADWPTRPGSSYLATALLAVGAAWLVLR